MPILAIGSEKAAVGVGPKLLTLLLAALLLGCVHGIKRSGFDACTDGNTCTLGGKLQLFPGEPAGAAILTDSGRCAKLALPDAFYTDPLRQQWHSQFVEVQGRAFAQPNTEADLGVLSWFSEKDRKLATGMCDYGPGVYVDTLRSASGRIWPGSP